MYFLLEGGNMHFLCGANKKVTDGAKQNWRAAGALRIFRFFLVYVD
jgi:hypothetical protein